MKYTNRIRRGPILGLTVAILAIATFTANTLADPSANAPNATQNELFVNNTATAIGQATERSGDDFVACLQTGLNRVNANSIESNLTGSMATAINTTVAHGGMINETANTARTSYPCNDVVLWTSAGVCNHTSTGHNNTAFIFRGGGNDDAILPINALTGTTATNV